MFISIDILRQLWTEGKFLIWPWVATKILSNDETVKAFPLTMNKNQDAHHYFNATLYRLLDSTEKENVGSNRKKQSIIPR